MFREQSLTITCVSHFKHTRPQKTLLVITWYQLSPLITTQSNGWVVFYTCEVTLYMSKNQAGQNT